MPGRPGGGAPGRRPTAPGRAPTRTRPPAPVARATVPESKEVEVPLTRPVPSLRDQLMSGNVLTWIHDTSLESMNTYRYRVRLILINPLLTHDNEVKETNRQDARAATVETPFSDWSDPVVLGKDTQFFLTGSFQATGKVTVTVFTNRLGQPVKEPFSVVQGQMIGEKKTVSLFNPGTGQRKKLEVDFSTGAIVVGCDFDKTVYKNTRPKKTVEMIYLDDQGELETRIMATDKESEDYKRMRKEVREAGTN